MDLVEIVNRIVELELWLDSYGICETVRPGCDCGCGGDSISDEEFENDYEYRKELKELYIKIDNTSYNNK